jgi:SAM-dependent methyltransferase
MTEPLLPTAVRLAHAAEALAALTAHVRVETEGLDVDPNIRAVLRDISIELTGSAAVEPDGPGLQVVGMACSFLAQSLSLIDDPGTTGDWNVVDEQVLQGLGRLSMAVVLAFVAAADRLAGMSDALARPGAAFLDVGTGTGWLAIATARAFPAVHVVGIDVFEPALRLARGNVAAEGMAERVTLRALDVVALEGGDTFDAVWLPLPFLPHRIVMTAIERARDALRPGGWVLPGTFAGPDEPLAQLLADLRILRSGGHPWTPEEARTMLVAAGLTEVCEVERTWPGPVRLFAGRRPER